MYVLLVLGIFGLPLGIFAATKIDSSVFAALTVILSIFVSAVSITFSIELNEKLD